VSTYVGRQPIFDQEGICFGYELLYRTNDTHNMATFQDNAKATTRVIINLIHNIGITPVIGHKQGFVNVDETMLFSDALLLLPKESFSFEILEYTQVSLALYERVKYLHRLGYRFSLDDFDCTDEMFKTYQPLFPYIDILKIDIQAIGLTSLNEAVSKLKKYTIPLLAEKIETPKEYEACCHLGFKFYQGYFFEKPVILSGREIEPETLKAIKLINCIHKNNDPTFISKQFATCPDLVYNLLRHVNSGAYHFKQKITSIKQMILLLGPQKLLAWLSLFLYGAPYLKPFGNELFNTAKFRAKLMEELTFTCNQKELATKAFLTGSLSLLDTYLNLPMNAFLEKIYLDDDIKCALLNQEGFLGKLLHIAIKINHNHSTQEIIQLLGGDACCSIDQLHDACLKATIFVEATDDTPNQ